MDNGIHIEASFIEKENNFESWTDLEILDFCHVVRNAGFEVFLEFTYVASIRDR